MNVSQATVVRNFSLSANLWSLVTFSITCLAISCLLYTLVYIFSRRPGTTETISEYECGFAPFDDATRQPFSVHYFVVSILFLIFDVEIIVLVPWLVSMESYGFFGFFSMFLFVVVLIVGFAYEWYVGALKWPQFESNQPKINTYKTSGFGLVFFVFLENLSKTFDKHLFTYIFYSFYLECFLLVLILLSLLQMIFFKFTLSKTASTNNTVGIALVNEKIKSSTGHSVDTNYKNTKFSRWILPSNHLSPSDTGLVLQKFYSFALTSLLFFNCLVLIADVSGCVNFIKVQAFYINFFDSNFILDYVWHDRVYLCISSLLIFLCLFIVRITEYNFNLIRGSGPSEFYFFILNSLFFFLVSIKSNNFIVLLVGIIGFSIVTYFLILMDSKNPLACESAIKYYYLSVLSSAFIAFGVFIIFVKFGTSSFSKLNLVLYYFVESSSYRLGLTVFLALFLIITGLLFKLNCFPCHWWSADVYYGLNYTLLAFFILPVKLCVYTVLVKISFNVFGSLAFYWQPYLLFAACGSMILGSMFAANELKIKKFLAYSSINQFGFVLINFVNSNVVPAQSVLSSFFFVLIYLVMNVMLLMILNSTFGYTHDLSSVVTSKQVSQYWLIPEKRSIGLNSRNLNKFNLSGLTEKINFDVWKMINFNVVNVRELKYLTDLKKFTWYNWNLTRHIVIIFLSMAGIPPLAGFFTKLYVLGFAVEHNQLFMVVCALLSSLISSYYYIRVIKVLFFEPISQHVFVSNRIKKNCFVSYLSTYQIVFLEILLNLLCFILVIESLSSLLWGSPWSAIVISFVFSDISVSLINFSS